MVPLVEPGWDGRITLITDAELTLKADSVFGFNRKDREIYSMGTVRISDDSPFNIYVVQDCNKPMSGTLTLISFLCPRRAFLASPITRNRSLQTRSRRGS